MKFSWAEKILRKRQVKYQYIHYYVSYEFVPLSDFESL